MKLETEIIDYIFNVVKTGDIVNVDNIIIEPNMVRSMDEARTVGLFTNENVPDMPFNSIGITRIHDLLARFSIAMKRDDFTIEVTTDPDGVYATKLVLKASKLKIDYRCGEPGKIAAPKVLHDVECFRLQLTEDAVDLYQKGNSAMSTDEVSMVSNDGVSFEFTDLNHDIYKCNFADTVVPIPNDEGKVPSSLKFAHRYPAKTLMSLFKNNPTAEFTIGQKGMMRFPLNDMTVFVLPRV